MTNIAWTLKWLLGKPYLPPIPKPDPSPPIGGTDKDVFDAHNRQRIARGKSPLEWDDLLAKQAVQWAQVCASTRRLSHTGFQWRLREAGYHSGSENLHHAPWLSSPNSVVIDWMVSDGHSANILGDWSAMGAGFCDYRGGRYWVALYGRK